RNFRMSKSRALLVCAGGGIGDSLLASICAQALLNKYDAVDALTLPGHRETLEHVPEISEVFVDEGEPVKELAERFKGRYAASIVTWATQRTAQIPFRARIRIRAGQSRRLHSRLFTHQVDVRSETGDVTTHWSQILLDYARALGCDAADPKPHFQIAQWDREAADRILKAHAVAGRFAIVHPTCSVSPKRPHWPVDGWIALVRELQTRYGVTVLISGTSDDAAIVAPLAASTGAISFAGEASIGAFAAITQRAEFFLVMHSGPMHVAAAVGTPTVGIFPLQADFPDRWAPLGERVAISRASFACRPGERMETCPDYLCVANLGVPQVLASLAGLLQRSGERAH
ncbi:MAG: glycosyltransferase family 9 protein, partial [Candidatus Eremiobacteraeota bacterium]|nr:glycosyltransferase family 9 protein [Candidatus Eremiobacteraeota bacterium]